LKNPGKKSTVLFAGGNLTKKGHVIKNTTTAFYFSSTKRAGLRSKEFELGRNEAAVHSRHRGTGFKTFQKLKIVKIVKIIHPDDKNT